MRRKSLSTQRFKGILLVGGFFRSGAIFFKSDRLCMTLVHTNKIKTIFQLEKNLWQYGLSLKKNPRASKAHIQYSLT